jgi:hypothetical protein
MYSMSVAHLGQLEGALQAVGLVGVGHVAEVDVGAVALVVLAEHHHRRARRACEEVAVGLAERGA